MGVKWRQARTNWIAHSPSPISMLWVSCSTKQHASPEPTHLTQNLREAGEDPAGGGAARGLACFLKPTDHWWGIRTATVSDPTPTFWAWTQRLGHFRLQNVVQISLVARLAWNPPGKGVLGNSSCSTMLTTKSHHNLYGCFLLLL